MTDRASVDFLGEKMTNGAENSRRTWACRVIDSYYGEGVHGSTAIDVFDFLMGKYDDADFNAREYFFDNRSEYFADKFHEVMQGLNLPYAGSAFEDVRNISKRCSSDFRSSVVSDQDFLQMVVACLMINAPEVGDNLRHYAQMTSPAPVSAS